MLQTSLPNSTPRFILQTQSLRGVKANDEQKIKAQLAPRMASIGSLDAKGPDLIIFFYYLLGEFATWASKSPGVYHWQYRAQITPYMPVLANDSLARAVQQMRYLTWRYCTRQLSLVQRQERACNRRLE